MRSVFLIFPPLCGLLKAYEILRYMIRTLRSSECLYDYIARLDAVHRLSCFLSTGSVLRQIQYAHSNRFDERKVQSMNKTMCVRGFRIRFLNTLRPPDADQDMT